MALKRRLKSILAALLVTALPWAGQHVHAAGTTPLSLVQQFDSSGQPLANCALYFFVAGTVDAPQNSFSDFGLTQNPNSVVRCDQSGRVPQHWLADGLIHIRLTDAAGLVQVDTTMQVLGPSSGGGGGGGTVDPTALVSTGDLKVRYGTGPIAGYVRTNGLTIGNGTSGATERAGADTQALWIYLYGEDPNLAVSGGRTGNALNDFNAGKTIALPDWSGQALAALDDQGAGPAGRLTPAFFGTSATVLGANGGGQSHTIQVAEVPSISVSGVNTINVANASQAISVANASQAISVANASQAINVANAAQAISVANAAQAISVSGTFSGNNSISASGANSISVTSASNRIVHNTGLVNSAAAPGGVEGIFADVNAVTMTNEVSSNASQAISVANAAQAISVSGNASGNNSISASGNNSISASGTNAITASGNNSISASGTNAITASGSNTITGTSINTFGQAMSLVSPMKLATIYLKL